MADEFVSAPLVCADGFASVVIVFEHGIVLETRIGGRDGEAARTSKKLNAMQGTRALLSWSVLAHHARIIVPPLLTD